MDGIFAGLKILNEYGFWAGLSVIVQISILAIGVVFVSRRRRVPNLNFTFALVEGELKDRTYSNRQLTILVRNLSGMDVLIGSATFSAAHRGAISEYADGDAASNEYELKFKSDDDHFSNAFALIKSTHHVETWVPANEEIEPEKLIQELHGRPFRRSVLRCQIILLTRRPEIINCRIRVRNIQYRSKGLYKRTETETGARNDSLSGV